MKHLLIISLLAVSVTAFAREKVSGKIFYGDRTTDVTFLIPVGLFGGPPDTQALQKGVRYLDPNGKKRRLKPGKATAFEFTHWGQTYKMVSQALPSMFARTVFMLQVMDGRAKMFEYTVTTSRGAGPNGMPSSTTTTTHYLIQTQYKPLYEPTLIGFKKRMADYFSDCPQLASLIEQKEFRRRDLDEIVMYYNTQCE